MQQDRPRLEIPRSEYPHPPVRRSAFQPLLLIACLIAVVVAATRFGANAEPTPAPEIAPRAITARGDLAADELATIDLFEQCSQSVVYVSPAVRRVRRSIFGYSDTVVETGTGSGFIWDKQGHVVTNFHVIQNADQCRVTLPNNTTYEADLIGAWPDKDIAVLRIDAAADTLVPISVGVSHDLRVGQKVFAIGNPYGLDFTLTTGVVSALNREILSVTQRPINGVIQTDAAINPGNSGGPLLDSAGRLIGINTAIFSQSGSSAGIGFAVPVDYVNDIVPQLIAHGKIIRPGLGINIADDRIARRLGLDGVLILSVAPDSGAALAGLQPTTESREGRIVLGDVIVAVGENKISSNAALLNLLSEYEVGDTVDITVDRQGERVTVPVTLQAVEERARVIREQ